MANLSKEARGDRQRKEEAEILLRSDEAYLEIEQFKDYEFSWCIAFEMAKRDPMLLNDTKRFIQFYQDHKSQIAFIPHSLESFEEAFEYRLHRKAKAIFEIGYDYFAQTHWLAPVDLYYITGDETALEMAEVYVDRFRDTQAQLPNERLRLEDDEGVRFESSVQLNNDHFFEDKVSVSDKEILAAIDDFDIDPSMITSERRVTESFARPKLSIPAMYNKNIQIELNLALPEKELLAYVSHIKEKFDEHKERVRSPIELLGAELSLPGLDVSDAEQLYKKDRRKTLPEKCADLLFIYDCNANNLSMNYTIDRLNRYWNDERNAFPEQFQTKTYKRYLKTAKDFIKNRQYQSLLVG